MSARVRRLGRVLRVEAERVSAKERDVARARAAVAAAEAEALAASRALEASLGMWLEGASAADLAAAASRRETLRLAHERATGRVAAAIGAERIGEAALVAARVAERRIEILVETMERAEGVRASRAERREADEHVARAARQRRAAEQEGGGR